MAGQARNHSILILGAGELGNEVITALYNHPQRQGTSTTVLLRPDPPGDPNASTLARRELVSTLQSKGIHIIRADIASASQASLTSTFSNYSTIVGCTGMAYPSGTQLKICKAVLGANVHRYLPWQYGMDYDVIGRGSSQDLFSEQLDVRHSLRSQEETKWVIVSTGLFMSFLFEPAFGVISEGMGCVTALGAWENSITVTTPRDIGWAVAEVVFDEEVNGVVHIAGETASYERVAQYVEEERGGKVSRELKTLEQLEEELKADPENGMKKYRAVFAEGKGVAWPMDRTFNLSRGMEFCGILEYLAEKVSTC